MLLIETPKQALLRAINQNNSLQPPLKVSDVEFDTPEIWIQGNTNTRVRITMVDPRNYHGSDWHYYPRVRIYDYFAGWSVPGSPGDYPDIRSAVVAMYTKYHLPLDPDDIVNGALSPSAQVVTLQGRNTNLMFVPNLTVQLPFEN